MVIPLKIYNTYPSYSQELINSNTTLNSWKTLNPGYKIKYWFKNDCERYLKENFPPEYLYCYNKLKPFAYKADFFRYCIVYKEGGWYTDWGQQLFISLNELNKENYNFVFCLDICWDYCVNNKCMQNAFIGSEPGNIVLKNVINTCIKNIKNNFYGKTSLDITGPYVFGKSFEQERKNLKNKKYLLGTFENSKEFPNGYFKYNNKIVISHKHEKSKNNNYASKHYTNMWVEKDVYENNKENVTKSSFGKMKNNVCILITTCVYIKTNYYNQYNTPEVRLKGYLETIDKWLNNTNLDIKIVESSNYKFLQYADNPRVQVYSFKSNSKFKCKNCDATPYEAESILLAFKNLNLKNYDIIIKITGKYYLPTFDKIIDSMPNDYDIYFQHTYHPQWRQQNSEIFGCNTKHLENIMNLIIKNSESNMNFESTLYTLNKGKYKVFRFPKIKLEKPIRRSGDNSIIEYL